MSNLVRRTNLMVSLESSKGLNDLWQHGADAVTLDSRDAISEGLEEETAEWMCAGLAAPGGAEVFVRADAGHLERQLEAAVWPGITGVTLSQVESAADVSGAAAQLKALEWRRGIQEGSLQIIPLLETALGVWNVRKIVTASSRVTQAALDEGSLCRDLDVTPRKDIDPLTYARGRLVIEATAAGVQPLGALAQGLPGDALLREGVRARDLGFKGALFSNPRWVGPLNTAFSPTQEQVEYYTEVREVFAQGVARATAAVPLRGRMVDVPVDEWAKAVLERAARCRARDQEKRQALEKMRESWARGSSENRR